ncbi:MULTISPECIES: DUF3565 domain-containing protein [Pseudomonas]|jgi:hypothetical protein|uniref:DUF3565 domain-containing protein n=2 Tax=Pseudomonas TaxID=286 RepID=A0AA42UMM6_9PSED|nr:MULTISPECIES: DUF3565 domain-containing protein [Pseudomonas]MBI6897398.1 DUF3565 domain-containing protein [Pseudomonas putida]ATB67993.1 DUF3565 domain-containing protein [Pseudomonas mosselii]MBC3435167.1 DUF3565 domain-containing protein [Pseudomonas sp. BW16M2]MBC3449537.1 DUF3565 domain-containing protein [Pseudomonas mosselii]MBC3457054.1 DUF3565 domain-containing protein [Pseudomonas mosselii]
MGQDLLQKNVERTSVTNASTDCERDSDQGPPISRITGFHLDEEGHWVVELSCGHTQHLRHQPPWQARPWVLDADERARRIGQVFACGWCAQGAVSDTLGR